MNKMITKFVNTILFICVTALLSGCVLVATGMQVYEDTGLSQNDRRILFERHLKQFIQGVSSGDLSRVGQYIDQTNSQLIIKELRKELKQYKWVDYALEEQTEGEDTYEITAILTIKKFNNSDYLVREVEEKQLWRFSVGDVWRLVSRTSNK